MTDRSVAIKGGFWTSISTVVTMLAQIIRLMILTRFLEKSDFGIVAISAMIIGLCETFTDLGFASVIMYKQKLSDEEFSSLYWIQFLFFSAIWFFLFLFTPFISEFYNEPLLRVIIPISSLSIIGQAIGKLYDSVLLKKYCFKTLAFRNILSVIVSLFLAWWLAANDYGVYSMIYSALFSTFLVNIWNLFTGFKFQKLNFCLKIKETVPLIKIGIYQTGTHILDYLSNKLDIIIIGKILGTTELGIYNLAKELVVRFVSLIKTVVQKVALPIISNNNNDDTAVISRFLSLTKVVAYICIPICITVAVFSESVVRTLYGNNFIEVSPIVSIFAICTMFSSIVSFVDMLGIAKGRTDLNFKQTIYRILVTTPIIFVASYIGIKAIAWGQLLTLSITFTICWTTIVMKTYMISIKKYFSQFGHYLLVFSLLGMIISLLRIIGAFRVSDNWIVCDVICLCLYLILIGVSCKHFLKNEMTYMLSLINKEKK